MVYYIDRESHSTIQEPVWGRSTIELLYKPVPGFSWLQKIVSRVLSIPFFSKLWGYYHDLPYSKKRIQPFCKRFNIDLSTSKISPDSFQTFNDFFTRPLTTASRPRCLEPHAVLVPADARYTFFENIQADTSFLVKGTSFNLETFLGSQQLAKKYYGGTLILGRLCPLDCHRFYFPYQGIAKQSKPIPGPLFSVNPIATKEKPWIFWTNKREITEISIGDHTYCMAEIGATNCGTIIQTFTPGQVSSGQEKGFFKLGGSALILLFEPGRFELAHDIHMLTGPLEIYCKIGQKLGRIIQ